ncbi:MAG TPA: PLAT/LH2 domain-containing protein, partial [Pyrinomonadaceae bacterium]|nr:PLAT/LH2 domain-containing protein [Pyrinomonadaceae bacterium]
MKKKIMQLVSLIGLVIALFAVTTLASPVTLKIQTGNPTGAGGYGSFVKIKFQFVDDNGRSEECETNLKDADLSNSALSEIKVGINCNTYNFPYLNKIQIKNTAWQADGAWYCNTITIIYNEIPRENNPTVDFQINRWFEGTLNGNDSAMSGVFYNTRKQRPKPTPKPIELTSSADTPSANPSGWTECAVEGEQSICSYEGVKLVSYGAEGKWIQNLLPGSIECKNNTFGDPAPNILKKCYLQSVKPQPTPQPITQPTPQPKPQPTPQPTPQPIPGEVILGPLE